MNTCSICKHDNRKEIEKAMALGKPLRTIANQYGTTHPTLIRHRQCIIEALEKIDIKKELGTVATIREVLEELTFEMRADVTDLFGDDGSFDVAEIKAKGLGGLLKSLTFKRVFEGPKDARVPVDIIRAETHGRQGAAKALLQAYMQLEIARIVSDQQLLSNEERAQRVAAILARGQARLNGISTV